MNNNDKIKDMAQRIARLGAYLSSPYGPTAKKEKGLLHMMRSLMNPLVLMCDLRDGRVWEREIVTGKDYGCPEVIALDRLAVFERQITEAVERQLREEVLGDLVAKRLRRITKAKSRGFQSDKRSKDSKRQQATRG